MSEWSTDTRDLVAAVLRHHYEEVWGHDEVTDAILTALTDAGALLPAGGETTQHFGFDVDGYDRPLRCPYDVSTCIALDYGPYKHEHRYTQQRRLWPDGSEYHGPWREVGPDA